MRWCVEESRGYPRHTCLVKLRWNCVSFFLFDENITARSAQWSEPSYSINRFSCEYIWMDDLYFMLEKPFFTIGISRNTTIYAGALLLQFRHLNLTKYIHFSGCYGNGNFLSWVGLAPENMEWVPREKGPSSKHDGLVESIFAVNLVICCDHQSFKGLWLALGMFAGTTKLGASWSIDMLDYQRKNNYKRIENFCRKHIAHLIITYVFYLLFPSGK